MAADGGHEQLTESGLHLPAAILWKGAGMVLWQRAMYRDDRLFILDLQPATKGDRQVSGNENTGANSLDKPTKEPPELYSLESSHIEKFIH